MTFPNSPPSIFKGHLLLHFAAGWLRGSLILPRIFRRYDGFSISLLMSLRRQSESAQTNWRLGRLVQRGRMALRSNCCESLLDTRVRFATP